MKKLLISSLGLASVALVAGQANAAVIVLDTFNDGFFENEFEGPAPPLQTVTSTPITAPGILAGARTVTHTLDVSPDEFGDSTVFVNGSADVFGLNNDGDVVAEAGAGYSFSPDINLDNGSFVFQIVSYDAPASDPAELVLTVNGVEVEQSIPLGATEVSFPLSDFVDLGLTQPITTVDFLITGAPAIDIRIDQFDYVVPEPMTILGTGLALAALPGLKKAHGQKKSQ